MTLSVPARFAAGCLLLATTLGATACGSSKSGQAAAPAAGSRSVTVNPTMPSKAEVTAKINAVCSATATKYRALPQPTSAADPTAVAKFLTGSLELFASYVSQVEPLVVQSPDRVTLQTKWLDLEKQETEQAKPAIAQLEKALAMRDDAGIAAAEKALDAIPDRTDEFISIMNAHGLTECAKLETDTES